MEKLYFVDVTFEGSETVPVLAESEEEAEALAVDCVGVADIEFDTSCYTREVKECQLYFKEHIPVCSDPTDRRTCEEIIEDQNRERKRMEAEALEPRLPGF